MKALHLPTSSTTTPFFSHRVINITNNLIILTAFNIKKNSLILYRYLLYTPSLTLQRQTKTQKLTTPFKFNKKDKNINLNPSSSPSSPLDGD